MAKDVSQKRKAVKVRPIERKQAGKVVEPYRVLESLIEEHHPQLKEATILLCYRKGWKPDVDGVLIGARIKKASDLDRAIGSRFGDSYDFVLQLNEDAWPHLTDVQKRILMDHELTHAAPDLDRDGEQRKDERERWCWRLRKHPIQEFPEIIARYGAEQVLPMCEIIGEAVDRADMPLFNAASGEAESDGAWQERDIDTLASHPGVTPRHLKALREAHMDTVGELAAQMDRLSTWWHRDVKGIGKDSAAAVEDAVAAVRGMDGA